MRVEIHSARPDYVKELHDLVDVFLPKVRAGEDSVLKVIHSDRMDGEQRHSLVRLSGALSGEFSLAEALHQDPVIDKRLHKRQVKLVLYHALKQATGQHPPWGSLTGIRPTRLIYEALDEGLSIHQATGRMMALFDLRPENAGLLAQVVHTQQQLPQALADEVDVYIGIPFCPSRCRYCSFISRQVGRGELLEPYTNALLKEIDAAVLLMAEAGLRPRAFYMGGGTPTAMTAPQLERILRAAQPLMKGARERTVEAGRPDSINAEKLRIIREAGVERISVNPQTAHDQTLEVIGRTHSVSEAEAAFHLAREAGFSIINMDLIAGLPGEDRAMFEHTLQWVAGLKPENLTVHTLCVKRSSDMHRLKDSLPDEETVAFMVQLGRATADCLSMNPYYLYRQKHMAGNQANVGYALPGQECLYNVDTMEDTVSVLALGAGAISKRVTKGRETVSRAPNVKELHHYLTRVDEMIARKRALFV